MYMSVYVHTLNFASLFVKCGLLISEKGFKNHIGMYYTCVIRTFNMHSSPIMICCYDVEISEITG